MLVGTMVSAQKAPPPPNHKSDPTDPPGTPIDGGLLVLLGAGIAYGIKQSKEEK